VEGIAHRHVHLLLARRSTVEAWTVHTEGGGMPIGLTAQAFHVKNLIETLAAPKELAVKITWKCGVIQCGREPIFCMITPINITVEQIYVIRGWIEIIVATLHLVPR